MATLSEALAIALEHHQSGRLDLAEDIYRRILAVEPEHAEAWHLTGVVAHQRGQHEAAAQAIRRAIDLQPSDARFHNNLGEAYRASGQNQEAVACYRRAVELAPLYVTAHVNLGVALRAVGSLEEALTAYRQAREINPRSAEALSGMGNTWRELGDLHQAVDCYRRAIQSNPELAEVHSNLGLALQQQGNLDEALDCCRRAVQLKPDLAHAHNNLGLVLRERGELDQAVACYGQAIQLQPDLAAAYNNLGSVLKDQALLDDAITHFERAMQITPQSPDAASNQAYTLLFHPQYDARRIYDAHRRWNDRYAAPLAASVRPHANDRSPNRRLRVGYVSPDFCNHVVGRNLLPLFAHHDRQAFDVVCYAGVAQPDHVTERLQAGANTWRNVCGLSDESLAEHIRQDRIDILVDLSLHMAGNRLLVFARKPAPVQVTFAGYPGTTGLSAIDYRLTDPYLDPPGADDSSYAEQSIRLPHSFWCYEPSEEAPEVNPLPATATGQITFGCLNNFCKVNPPVLRLWAAVLRRVKRSRLLMLAPLGAHRQRIYDLLKQEGIAEDRLTLVPPQHSRRYLELYHQIDLVLDTVPYNGHTTGLDAFWMGVPVVTLVGQTVVGRAGLSQLTNLGLAELAGHTPDDFVRIAVDLAADVLRLAELRATLRQRMRNSPLMDAPRFAHDVQTTYHTAWRQWCARQPWTDH
jgi:predicted O-linked N-acetylglucosamine transferase (SPINDLY family)